MRSCMLIVILSLKTSDLDGLLCRQNCIHASMCLVSGDTDK